eukprot:CAMPEP_0173443906 /NCGR_PEP_ID=MMETSP1357-20121228/31066_1 /TAXON_ID=77926 /ORGANISM="Hemiselmis rufescens, Strain PCC563" /LENGTH=64 /DNA_ID=CAMNT_0014409889 /DNA_START=68 /DNA_END=262 /DNA_ORIENTATION=+
MCFFRYAPSSLSSALAALSTFPDAAAIHARSFPTLSSVTLLVCTSFFSSFPRLAAMTAVALASL